MYIAVMQHRHLNHRGYSPAAIDDVIERGNRRDWADLRDAARTDPNILGRILKVCLARTMDPYAQRYHLWKLYAERRLA